MANGNMGGNDAGRVLNNRYQLIGVVGGGGMAQVYKARDNILGRVVAVKVLRDQYTRDVQFVARFRREAQAAANLAHPNIVSVYDVGQDGDLHYIVMENIVGENLKDLINRAAPLPADAAVSLGAQILSALEYAHRSGLIHRDIKPQNVLITPQGVAKVTDFGIAKSVSDLGLTEAGLALGTAHYFSPEQAKGERVVPQSDIYAAGITMYEMLTGKLPFESENAMGLAYKHINEAPTPPSHIIPNIPPRLETIVLKAIAKDPAQRYASAAEMEKALRNLETIGSQATTAVPVARPNVTSSPSTRQANKAASGGGRSAGAQPPNPNYPAAAGAGVGMGAATRQMPSPLGAPTSVAMRPTGARSGGMGCTTVGITLLVLGVLAIAAATVIWFGPTISSIFSPQTVVSSPTPTPVIPTDTPTSTPTRTRTSTSTVTPTATSTPMSTVVPKLVGLKSGEARALATQTGFEMQEDARVETLDWPEDVVFQQDPEPDRTLKKGSVIRVRVSDGPPPVQIQSVTNSDPQDAKAYLVSSGFVVEMAYEGSLNIPKGVVTRTEPSAGSLVKPGRTVKLFVSLGETSRVPDLTGMTQELAEQVLSGRGLTIGAVTEVGRADVGDDIDKVPPGAVYSQEPAPNAEVTKGSPINIRLRRRE